MVSLIFLAGGCGARLGSKVPKQFLELNHQPIYSYSLSLFQRCSYIREIIVVCDPQFRHFFKGHTLFALPGKRRQDSVYSGLQKASCEIVLTHDAARPFVEEKYLPPLIKAIENTGAAALGCPATNTIKECLPNQLVNKTLDRSKLWEMQSPQGMKKEIFLKCFDAVIEKEIEVTDDISMCEWINHPSEIVPSSPKNFKITHPFDLRVARALCAIK